MVRKPGVQKPHCRPWHSRNACCTGLHRRRGRAEALDGGDLVAVDRDREHAGTSAPARRRAAPCRRRRRRARSRRGCRSGRRSWRRKSDSSRRAGTGAERGTPLTVSRMSCSCSAVGSLPRSPLMPLPRRASARQRRRRSARRSARRPAAAGSRRWRGCRPRGRPGRAPGRRRAAQSARRPARPGERRASRSSTGGIGVTETNDARAERDARRRPRVDRDGHAGRARSRRAGGPTSRNAVPVPGANRPKRTADGQLVRARASSRAAREEVGRGDLAAPAAARRPRRRRR